MLNVYLLMLRAKHEGSTVIKAATDPSILRTYMARKAARENESAFARKEAEIAEAFRDLKSWAVEAEMWDGDDVEMRKIHGDWNADNVIRSIGDSEWRKMDLTWEIRVMPVESPKPTPGISSERYGDGVGGLTPGLV